MEETTQICSCWCGRPLDSIVVPVNAKLTATANCPPSWNLVMDISTVKLNSSTKLRNKEYYLFKSTCEVPPRPANASRPVRVSASSQTDNHHINNNSVHQKTEFLDEPDRPTREKAKSFTGLNTKDYNLVPKEARMQDQARRIATERRRTLVRSKSDFQKPGNRLLMLDHAAGMYSWELLSIYNRDHY